MKLHIHFRNFVLAFTEYPVENFHSMIRDQASPHSTPQQITNTCCSIFASKLRQGTATFRQTFLPTKIFVLPRNQLKAAESLTNIFKNIISKPNNSYSANSMDDEKRERMLPFLYENMCKSKMVLPCGLHLSHFEDLEPDPLRDCDLLTCQKQDDSNWCVLKGCGYSFQVTCVPNRTCPICQEDTRRHVRGNA